MDCETLKTAQMDYNSYKKRRRADKIMTDWLHKRTIGCRTIHHHMCTCQLVDRQETFVND